MHHDKVSEDGLSQHTIPRLPPSTWAHQGTQHTKYLRTDLSPRRGSRASGGDWWKSLSLKNKTCLLKCNWQFQDNLHYVHHTMLRTFQRLSIWLKDARLTNKSVMFLHTSNKCGIVTIATSKMKELTVNLTKYTQDLYKENYEPSQRNKITNTQRYSALMERKAQCHQHVRSSRPDP